jgi:arylsulfatase A-like enzyme
VIFVLVDDMGYADVGVYGNAYHLTPHIDRLAAEGMRFSDAYAAAPNCSPTRASIVTGKWPARLGLTQYLPGNHLPYARLTQAELPEGLPLDETILPEILGSAGYTTASIGKWHLGGGRYLPERRGFDLNFAGGPWGHHTTMFAPHPTLPVPNARRGDYLTDRLALESEEFIQANRHRPFFLYLSLYAVHEPVEGKKDLIAKYRKRRDPSGRNDAVYAAMVEGVDRCVGRLMAKLADLGLEDRTIIFFFSDNGGSANRAFHGGFRGGKGRLYEGGIRAPLIVKWPGVAEPGSTTGTAVSSVDFVPTILAMTGVESEPEDESDGVSLVPLLAQTGALERDTLFWHYPHYSNAGGRPAGAIRKGNWKLIEFFENGRLELYDLSTDPGEKRNIAWKDPIQTQTLHTALRAWRQETRARMPRPNPDYDASRETQRRRRPPAEEREVSPVP